MYEEPDLSALADEIISVHGNLVATYDSQGNELTSGNDFLNESIPGTDTNLGNLLGVADILNIGQLILKL